MYRSPDRVARRLASMTSDFTALQQLVGRMLSGPCALDN
jgi:hypothetical protein